ncbi:MAG: DUF7134 domain-containing protein, partial [Actinomycetes bacterium]
MRAHPLATDALVALGAFATMLLGSFADPQGPHGQPTFGTRAPHLLSLVLMILAAAALVLRRRHPRAVLAATSALTLAELVTGEPRAPVAMGAVVALYPLASRTDRPTTWRVGLLTLTALTGVAMLVGPLPWYAQENLGVFAWT